jgi:hypothetical protein
VIESGAAFLARQLLAEKAQKKSHANMCQRRIVARPFVAQKRVGGIELMPFKVHPGFIETLRNVEPALERHVRVLSSPNEEQRLPNSPKPLQRVVSSASAQRTGVDIRGIKGDHRTDIRMKTCPHRKMPAKTDPVASDLACASLVSTQKLNDSAGILIVGREFLGVFELVPPIGTRLIVGQHRAGRLKLVIDLRDRNEISVAAQGGSHPPDRTRDLENFRIEDYSGMASVPLGDEQMHPHWSARSRDVDEGVRKNGH